LNVLIIYGGRSHDFDWSTGELVAMLEARRSARCRTVEGPDGLSDANLDWSDVVVINHQGGELSEDRAAALETFVRAGGGLLGIHSATASFRNSERYLRLIGCELQEHGPVSPIRIHLSDKTHQITAAVEDEFVICDEIYHSKVYGRATVLATANWQSRSCPVITINEFGTGRVCWNALGHDRRAWQQWEFRTLLMRCIDWVYRGPIAKTLGVGLVGVGPSFAMGSHHGNQISATFGLEVRAACDLDPERLAAIKKDFPDIATYQTLDEMLGVDDIDLVTVITPHNTHAELGLKCLRAGRHVVIEKPFCLTTAEATSLVELAERKDRMLSCYHNRHWDGEILIIRRIVESGRLGKVFQMQINAGGYGINMPREWWRSDKAISGGELYDWAAHHFEWFMQLAQSPARSVFAATNKVRWHWCTNEENAKVMITFENGTVADYHISELNPNCPPHYVTVWGSEGVAVIGRADRSEPVRVFGLSDGSEETLAVPTSQWGRYYWNIADHLHFGEPLVVTAQHARRVIALIEAAYRSAETAQAVTPAFP